MYKVFSILFFIGYMGVGGAVETGGSLVPALALMAVSLPAAYISYQVQERGKRNEYRGNHSGISSRSNNKF